MIFFLQILCTTIQPHMKYCSQAYGYGSLNVDLFTENKILMLVWTSASKPYRDLPGRFEKLVCEAFVPALCNLPTSGSSF